MKWAFLIAFALTVLFFIAGGITEHLGKKRGDLDFEMSADIPYGIGVILIAVDLAIALVWSLWSIFF